MWKLALIFIGSGTGGLLRYSLGGYIQRLTNGAFPLGTLTVNVLGCLLIGFLSATLTTRLIIPAEYRVALLVGVLGGFTTFSTFGLETFTLLNDGQFARAALNITASLIAGLAAVWLGYRLAQNWLGV